MSIQLPPLLLVVDDQQIHRDLMVRALGATYRTITASDGIEALKLIRTSNPDLVLLDVEHATDGRIGGSEPDSGRTEDETATGDSRHGAI